MNIPAANPSTVLLGEIFFESFLLPYLFPNSYAKTSFIEIEINKRKVNKDPKLFKINPIDAKPVPNQIRYKNELPNLS